MFAIIVEQVSTVRYRYIPEDRGGPSRGHQHDQPDKREPPGGRPLATGVEPDYGRPTVKTGEYPSKGSRVRG